MGGTGTTQMAPPLDASKMKIGVVTARFNWDVTSKLEAGAVKALAEIGCTGASLVVKTVPGAFEIPLAAYALLEAGCDGVVALGAVIRGETSHYDYVCSAVERGCTDVQLKFKKPVGFGILTTDNNEQAMDRAGGRHGNKGYEAAQVVVEMVQLLRSLAP